ncbi:MAG: hypothetical protein WCC65_02110 [Pseudonocardiaceae bacterium]
MAKRSPFPADARPALRPLLSGQPVNIQEIITATGVDAAALADALIAQGICAEVTPDLAEGYAGMLTPIQRGVAERTTKSGPNNHICGPARKPIQA